MKKLLENYKRWVTCFIKENYRWRDSKYLPKVTYQHLIKWFLIGFLCEGVLVYFFYRNAWAFLFLCWVPFIVVYEQWQGFRRQVFFRIENGFKEWIYYIKGGLRAGKSIENAMYSCKENFYVNMGENHPLLIGLDQVYHGLHLHIPIEECIAKLAMETKVEAIQDFAVVFQITKRQGGNMIGILDQTITQICEKIELREELYALFAAKKMEQRIMCVIPFGIMLFIGSASKGYFDSLYNSFQGVCIMSVCFIAYVFSVWWGEKLTEVSL